MFCIFQTLCAAQADVKTMLDEWQKMMASLCTDTKEQHDERYNEDKQLSDLTESFSNVKLEIEEEATDIQDDSISERIRTRKNEQRQQIDRVKRSHKKQVRQIKKMRRSGTNRKMVQEETRK